MPRARAAVVIAAGALVVGVGLAAGPTGAAQPVPPPTTLAATPTTVAATPITVAVTPSSVPASTPVTTVAPPASTIPRAPSGAVDVRKPEAASWDLRQVLTVVGLGIVALAALGYAYGRIRSIAPRHPGLVRSVE